MPQQLTPNKLLKKTVRARIENVANGWPLRLDDAFRKKFDIEVETCYNIIHMAYVTTRTDGGTLRPDHETWIEAYTAGFNEAAERIAAVFP